MLLKTHCKEGFVALNPPATNQEIDELKNSLGFDVPDNLVELLKIHNGQDREGILLFDAQEFLSAERIIEEWEVSGRD